MSALEIARLTSATGKGDDLAVALAKAIEFLSADRETQRIELYRGIEQPDEFTLLVTWSSVAAHEAWRKTEARERYRALVLPLAAGPIQATHHALVVRPK